MDRPYLQDLWIKNYGCIQDVHVTFSPLHALIGPNDSGKTTILRAIQSVASIGMVAFFGTKEQEQTLGRLLMTSALRGDVSIKMLSSHLSIKLTGAPTKVEVLVRQNPSGEMEWKAYNDAASFPVQAKSIRTSWGSATGAPFPPDSPIAAALRACAVLRLDPDALRTPRPLIREGDRLQFLDERGLGLPAIYDAIQNRDIDAFFRLNAELKSLFPDIKSLRLTNPDVGKKALGINLNDGTFVGAEHMSEGLLYYLAFAALRYIDPPAILLVEEPENGLHPARIAEVMRVLRELSKTTQIILATHSPLVINELEPHEVSVITRSREKGTQATLIKDTANFEERSKVYALGELWLSYANGIDEAPLLSGGPRP